MNKSFHRSTVLSWKVLLVYLPKQAHSCKEQLNANIIPKCTRKWILCPCVTSKDFILIFSRLSQWFCPTKRGTSPAVNESGHRADSKSRSDASGERRAELRVQQCVLPAEPTGAGRRIVKNFLLCCKTFTSSFSTSHQGKRPSQGLEHPTWQTQVCPGKTWGTWCTPWAGRWPTGPGTSEQGFEKSFQGPYTKSPFKSAP